MSLGVVGSLLFLYSDPVRLAVSSVFSLYVNLTCCWWLLPNKNFFHLTLDKKANKQISRNLEFCHCFRAFLYCTGYSVNSNRFTRWMSDLYSHQAYLRHVCHVAYTLDHIACQSESDVSQTQFGAQRTTISSDTCCFILSCNFNLSGPQEEWLPHWLIGIQINESVKQ